MGGTPSLTLNLHPPANLSNPFPPLKVFLRAQNNEFYGYIPSGITRLNKLREFYVQTNELYSDLPPDLGYMEDLEDFRVNENEMFGTIPDSLYDLAKLKQLWLQDTVHCVEVDENWNCEVDMDYGFEGSIRTEIGNLTKLEMLILNNNPLTGTIPTEIGNCEDLGERHCWVHVETRASYLPSFSDRSHPLDLPTLRT